MNKYNLIGNPYPVEWLTSWDFFVVMLIIAGYVILASMMVNDDQL